MTDILEEIQANLLARATALRDEHTKKLDSLDEFKAFFGPAEDEKGVASGGFALMHWAGSSDDEDRLAKEFKTTIRCIPHGAEYAEDGSLLHHRQAEFPPCGVCEELLSQDGRQPGA